MAFSVFPSSHYFSRPNLSPLRHDAVHTFSRNKQVVLRQKEGRSVPIIATCTLGAGGRRRTDCTSKEEERKRKDLLRNSNVQRRGACASASSTPLGKKGAPTRHRFSLSIPTIPPFSSSACSRSGSASSAAAEPQQGQRGKPEDSIGSAAATCTLVRTSSVDETKVMPAKARGGERQAAGRATRRTVCRLHHLRGRVGEGEGRRQAAVRERREGARTYLLPSVAWRLITVSSSSGENMPCFSPGRR